MGDIVGTIMAVIAVIGFLAGVVKYMVIDPNNKSNSQLQATIKDLSDLIKDFRREFQADLEKTNQKVENHEVRISVLEDRDQHKG